MAEQPRCLCLMAVGDATPVRTRCLHPEGLFEPKEWDRTSNECTESQGLPHFNRRRHSHGESRLGPQTGKSSRLGFVGIGGRRSYHLDCAPSASLVSKRLRVCDIDDKALYRAKRWVEEAVSPPHDSRATARQLTGSCARRKLWIASFAARRGDTMRQSASPG